MEYLSLAPFPVPASPAVGHAFGQRTFCGGDLHSLGHTAQLRSAGKAGQAGRNSRHADAGDYETKGFWILNGVGMENSIERKQKISLTPLVQGEK